MYEKSQPGRSGGAMKKLITILVTVGFLVTTMAPVAGAGGRGHGRGHGYRSHGYHSRHHGFPDYLWLGLGVGVLTGAIVSSYHYSPPPQRVVYYDPPPVVVSRPPVVVQRNDYRTPLNPAYGQVIVTVAELNMRSGPGLDRAVTGKVRKGDILAVIDSIPSWFYVRLPDGRDGWVMDRYTRPAQPLG